MDLFQTSLFMICCRTPNKQRFAVWRFGLEERPCDSNSPLFDPFTVQMNVYARLKENQILEVTIIEIRPFRNAWQVYESAGVQPVIESGASQ